MYYFRFYWSVSRIQFHQHWLWRENYCVDLLVQKNARKINIFWEMFTTTRTVLYCTAIVMLDEKQSRSFSMLIAF